MGHCCAEAVVALGFVYCLAVGAGGAAGAGAGAAGASFAGAAACFAGCLAAMRAGGRPTLLMGMAALMGTLRAGAGTGGRLPSVNAGRIVARFAGGGGALAWPEGGAAGGPAGVAVGLGVTVGGGVMTALPAAEYDGGGCLAGARGGCDMVGSAAGCPTGSPAGTAAGLAACSAGAGAAAAGKLPWGGGGGGGSGGGLAAVACRSRRCCAPRVLCAAAALILRSA